MFVSENEVTIQTRTIVTLPLSIGDDVLGQMVNADEVTIEVNGYAVRVPLRIVERMARDRESLDHPVRTRNRKVRRDV